jgi:hypothetical protein
MSNHPIGVARRKPRPRGNHQPLLWAMLFTLAGCEGLAGPPEPPPAHPIPPPPPLWPHQRPPGRDAAAEGGVGPARAGEGGSPIIDGGPPAPTAVGSGGAGATPRPKVTILIETPYKMGERPAPKTQAEYQEDILDRRHWNDGGLGELTDELPEPEGHPEPRVIVNVDKLGGPHQAKSVQRSARKHLWKPIINCYRLGAFKDPHLRGWTKARFTVSSAGKVSKPRMIDTELDDPKVAQCMVDKLAKLPLPRARRGSNVWVSMRVGPGDDPMPPPENLIVPGDGILPIAAMKQGIEAGLAPFEACYRNAFSYAPGLWGRLVVRFHVTKAGRLDEAFEAGSRFPDPRVRQCLLREARKLTFPKPQGGDIRFVVPLRLSSETTSAAHPDLDARDGE